MAISQPAAFETRFQDLTLPAWLTSEHTSTFQRHDHPLAPVLRLSAAGATVAPDIVRPLSASTHGPSALPPLLAYTAAIPWPNHSHWSVQELAGAGVSSHGAGRNCNRRGRQPAAGVSRPRLGTV